MSEQITSSIVEITPTTAREFLAGMITNRNVKESVVESYAGAMSRGEWEVNNSAIAFDASGAMIDGQHRCLACVRSGVSFRSFVVRGLQPKAAPTIDSGVPRSLNDRLAMFTNETNIAVRSATLRACVNIAASGKQISIRNEKERDIFMAHFGDGVNAAVRAAISTSQKYLPGILRRSDVLGALAFAHKKDPAAIETMTARLFDGADMNIGDPTLTLRNYLLGSVAATARRYRVSLTVLSAAMAHVQKRESRIARPHPQAVDFFLLAHDVSKIEADLEPWERMYSEQASRRVARRKSQDA